MTQDEPATSPPSAKGVVVSESKMRYADMPLLDRIEEARRRTVDGHAAMRIPVHATDTDVVLSNCRSEIESLRAKITALEADRGRLRGLLEKAMYHFATEDPGGETKDEIVAALGARDRLREQINAALSREVGDE